MSGKLLESAADIQSRLKKIKTIALVGASPNWDKASNQVMEFLMAHGYEVIPINPNYINTTILEQKVYASLKDLPKAVDMVDIFLPSSKIEAIVDDLLACKMHPQLLWLQLGIINEKAIEKATSAGIDVVANDCPKIHLCQADDPENPC